VKPLERGVVHAATRAEDIHDGVLDSAEQEDAFIGAATGAAAEGMRPIAELMFVPTRSRSASRASYAKAPISPCVRILVPADATFARGTSVAVIENASVVCPK
jgi:hypothetical protein